jgi:hypothetical protein
MPNKVAQSPLGDEAMLFSTADRKLAMSAACVNVLTQAEP